METQRNQVLKIEDLSFNFGKLEVLKNISFTVFLGELVCILGPSGCGKTTLLRTLAGLVDASSGRMVFGEKQSFNNTGRIDEIAIVFQEPRLLPWRTSRDNLKLPFELNKNHLDKEDERMIDSTLALVGLSDFACSYPHELSGGMRQRVSLARALVTNPRILFMDEPLTGLDVHTREELQLEIIRIWNTKRISLIWVTHDPGEAIFMADRIIVLSNRPTVVKKIINVGHGRPRNRNSNEMMVLEQQIRSLLH